MRFTACCVCSPRLESSNGEHGAWHHTDASRFLRSDHPGSLRDYVRMLGLPVFWNAFGIWTIPCARANLRSQSSHPEGVFEYLAKHPEESHIFDAAMVSKSHRDIAAILPAYDFSQFASIADIAGGRGHLLRAILKASPKTQGILFDQPHVVAGVAPEDGEKLTMVGGNFFTDSHAQSGRLPVDEYYPRLARRGIHQDSCPRSVAICRSTPGC